MSVSELELEPPLLVLGSKNYSSWSLRPWLFLRKAGFEFREHVIRFDAADYQAQIAALSPSRRVPLLIAGGVKIWDSVADCRAAATRGRWRARRPPKCIPAFSLCAMKCR